MLRTLIKSETQGSERVVALSHSSVAEVQEENTLGGAHYLPKDGSQHLSSVCKT